MRILLLIFSMIFAAQLMVAQSAEDELILLKQSIDNQVVNPDAATEAELNAEEKSMQKEDGVPGHWNFSVGTNFTYMHGYGSVMGFYAAPMYTLPLNDRWAVHGGFIASNYTGLGNQMPVGELQSSNNFSSLAVYLAASYKMTDRLILHGSALKNLTSYPLMPMRPGLMDNLSMGATYKLGDNISIGASIHINQGHGYYQAPPFGGASFGPYASPFGW